MAFKIGDTVEETFSFTQEQVNLFMELSGDNNPIHHDTDFAAETVFRKPIIHGFLASSVFSKILGIKMPGYGTIYLKQEIVFKKPMYTGEKYICRVTITDIQNDKYFLDTQIFNTGSDIVTDGKAVVLWKSAAHTS